MIKGGFDPKILLQYQCSKDVRFVRYYLLLLTIISQNGVVVGWPLPFGGQLVA